ncbi:MAG: glycosyltransferase family 39 protein [Elusimicrobia bacterium]|nr:glycosyltransferase family 39 protein [Elusimicrobiota bacterium]
MKKHFPFIAAALAVAFNIYGAVSFIRTSSLTYDEGAHLVVGYSYLKTGKYHLRIFNHPPFSDMLASAPLLFFPGLKTFENGAAYRGNDFYNYAAEFLYHNTAPAEKILNTARYFAYIVWTSLLFLFVFLFAREMADRDAAWWALAAAALTPAFISNNTLVTTDAPSSVLYLGAFLGAYLTAKNLDAGDYGRAFWRAALSGTLTGLAMVSKFNMALLPLFIAGTFASGMLVSPGRGFSKKILYLLLVYGAAALAVLLAVYRVTDVGLYFRGVLETSQGLAAGRVSFMNGLYEKQGVWWYFPYVFLVKTPLGHIALLAAGVFYSFVKSEKKHLWIYIPATLYLEFALTSKFQVAFRHLLPALPFVAVIEGYAMSRAFKSGFGAVAGSAALFCVFLSVAPVHPYYLSYFNELAGGPAGGYRHLVEANIDWGQDLKNLAIELRKRGNPPVYLCYFGTALPEYYGIKYVPFSIFSELPLKGTGEAPCSFKQHLLAVSVTNLQSVYYRDKRLLEWLREKAPVFKAGYSIFVYDLTGDEEGMRKIAEMLHLTGRVEDAACLKNKIEGGAAK